ncbi:MAG: hypothetical protein IJZ46_05925 [Bacilli bacterium]|nr:hypothetical protein [Bacilli bacterium]
MLTVNDVKKEAYNFISTYKKVYNDKAKKQELLKIANVDIKFIGRYCINIDVVATAVANILEVDRNKVKNLLINNTNPSLPAIKFNKKGLYYYLGDI